MPKTTDKDLYSVDRKLSIVISILLKIANNGEDITLRQQIKELHSFGLSSSEIAEILGKKIGHISKELSGIKKEVK